MAGHRVGQDGRLREAFDTDAGQVQVVCSSSEDGDFSLGQPSEDLERLRMGLCPYPWTWLRQAHGDRVVTVVEPGQHAGAVADGALTGRQGAGLSVLSADCAPVALVGSRGLAIVHAGWRGVMAGIIARAAEALRSQGSTPIAAVLGPCIYPEAYEFGTRDLALIVDRFGRDVAAETSAGRPALDLPALVRASCDESGWGEPLVLANRAHVPACTSNPSYFSHRTRGDQERQTMVGWIQ